MNRSPIQKSVSWLLVGLIGLFAISSLGNVHEFVQKYHHGWSTWPFAGGFSVAVFVCAYLAATSKSAQTRWSAIVVGGVFGIASGYFQMRLYQAGDADNGTAFFLSFIPIIVGEVGLALVEASHSKEHGEEELSAQAQELKVQLEALQTQYEKALTDSELVQTQLEDVKKQLEDSRNESEQLRIASEQLRNGSEGLCTQLESMRQRLEQYTIDSILNRLDDGKREKFVKLIETVETNRVQSPADLVKLEALNKSDAYALWPIATATGLVYLNGDGAYHVANSN